MKKILVAAIIVVLAASGPIVYHFMSGKAQADTASSDFESPGFTLGTVHNQLGWSSLGAAGSGCAVYDHAVTANTYGYSSFGTQSLRLSNAVTSGCFADQTFSMSLANEVGETGASNGGYSNGTRQNRFEAQFDIASTSPSPQPGLFISVSPDRGDGSRMSYVGFEDGANGINALFYDVQGTGNPANFVASQIATGLSRSVPHTIKMVIDFQDGPSNDIVRIYIDGKMVHIGTTWENYYRFDTEASAEQNPRTTDSLIFRSGGSAVPATSGNGFLFDNLSLKSGPTPAPTATTVQVTPANISVNGTDGGWFFFNDETNVIDNTLGSFVTGPGTPPLGNGSAQSSVIGTQRRNLSTYRFFGQKLGDITQLKFSTYNPSLGNGGAPDRSAYLNFNVDFDGSDVWQRRLVFVPRNNGTVIQDGWQEWDAINNGQAMWTYSGATWPVTNTGPQAGQTGISGFTPRSWNDILAGYPGVRVRVSDPWLGLRVGEPYADGYTENLDKFVFGTEAQITTFDFDPNPPQLLKVKIQKFLDGQLANATTANGYQFPMTATWQTANLNGGTQSSGNFVLGNSHGGSSEVYGADTSPMQAPADYMTQEITTDADQSSNVLPANAPCQAGKFQLLGYTTSDVSFADATSKIPTPTIPEFTQISSDRYVIVWNKTCPTLGTLTVNKYTIGQDGTFSFTGDGPLGQFNISTSSGQGSKVFSSLTPGNYKITETVPSGWTLLDNECANIEVKAGEDAVCNITNSKNNKVGQIRGTKYEDRDGNGNLRRDQCKGLPGWTVYIDSNNNGQLDTGEPSQVTNNKGEYWFKNLSAGTYYIREVGKPGWTQTAPKDGFHKVTLGSGKIAKDKNFGNFKNITISGQKFHDQDGDKKKDADEMGLAGWTISLAKTRGSTITAITDQNGNYKFENVGPGVYKVREVQQSGWKQTTQNPDSIKAYSGKEIKKVNFGNKLQNQNNHRSESHDEDDND